MSTTIPTPQMNEDLLKAVQGAINPEDIKAAILAEAQKQFDASQTKAAEEKAAADKKAADDKAAADAAAAAPKTFTRTEVIGGKEFTFEADSELALANKVNDAYRIAYSLQPSPAAETVVEKTPTPEEIAAKAQADAAAKAELELKFKRGELSTAEYLEQSGAMDDYLAKRGVSIDALKASVEQTQTAQYEKSWAEATEEFLHTAAGADWPGGTRNREQLGMRLAAMGLTDAKDKVAALALAYAEMKKTGSVFENEDLTQQQQQQQQQTQKTKTPAELAAEKVLADQAAARAAAAAAEAARKAPTSSSLFDRSSGVSEFVQPNKEKPAEFVIDPKATPNEIMDAWKKFQLQNGRDPNAAFTEAFSAKK